MRARYGHSVTPMFRPSEGSHPDPAHIPRRPDAPSAETTNGRHSGSPGRGALRLGAPASGYAARRRSRPRKLIRRSSKWRSRTRRWARR